MGILYAVFLITWLTIHVQSCFAFFSLSPGIVSSLNEKLNQQSYKKLLQIQNPHWSTTQHLYSSPKKNQNEPDSNSIFENEPKMNQASNKRNWTGKDKSIISRTSFLTRALILSSLSFTIATLGLSSPQNGGSNNFLVNAKDTELIDKQDMENLAMEYNLKVEEICKELETYINAKNWPEIKEQTKFYDLELRKKIMGKMKGTLRTKEEKVRAQELRNGVTFDLIGINKSARKEDAQEALRFLDIMRQELNDFQKLCLQ